MTTEELNAQLCQKLVTEQAQYREHLLALPPADILKSAYEYATRESILLTIENSDLHPRMAQALLELDKPLDDLFRYYEQYRADRTGEIRRIVDGKAIDAMHEAVRRKIQQGR